MQMIMTEYEIVSSYLGAKDPRKQIGILADLNLCEKADIAELLCRKEILSVRQAGQYRRHAKLSADEPETEETVTEETVTEETVTEETVTAETAPGRPYGTDVALEVLRAWLNDTDVLAAYKEAKRAVERYEAVVAFVGVM